MFFMMMKIISKYKSQIKEILMQSDVYEEILIRKYLS